MPIESVRGTNLFYYLVAFDDEGRERSDDPDGLMSKRLVDAVASEPVTDIFFMSHGWKGDIPAAKEQYSHWITAMSQCTWDIERFSDARPGFRPILIGLHWPSLPWGDEDFGGSDLSFGETASNTMEQFIERYAMRLADTPASRSALETIFIAASQDIVPNKLPPAVYKAYEVLNSEASLGSEGEGAAPGADREPFDPEEAFQAALDESVSFGGFELGGLLSPLVQLSFWKMKERARHFGVGGARRLLSELQLVPAARDVRFHLMGHSFGCIAVSAMLADSERQAARPNPVHSVALVQGALSLWSYCSDIPAAPGRPGYFHRIASENKVAGPIVTTQSEFDTAVGRLYPLGAGVRQQITFAPGELPKYGALGTFGARGPGIDSVDLKMLTAQDTYKFEPGKIYNLESSEFIREGAGLSGAHNDIAHREVAHAVWEAALPR